MPTRCVPLTLNPDPIPYTLHPQRDAPHQQLVSELFKAGEQRDELVFTRLSGLAFGLLEAARDAGPPPPVNLLLLLLLLFLYSPA